MLSVTLKIEVIDAKFFEIKSLKNANLHEVLCELAILSQNRDLWRTRVTKTTSEEIGFVWIFYSNNLLNGKNGHIRFGFELKGSFRLSLT